MQDIFLGTFLIIKPAQYAMTWINTSSRALTRHVSTNKHITAHKMVIGILMNALD